MMRLTTLEGVTVIRYFSASPLTSLRLLLCLRILVGSPFAVSVLRLSAIGLRDHPSSLHNNRPLLARSLARTHARLLLTRRHKKRAVLSRSDGEMFKLRFADSFFLSSFTSARSAEKPLRCAQRGTRRS